MAAGLGFKEFTTGDVLTAADANGFLASQVVMVFDDAAARATAITSPQEGMITYLKDTNAVEKFDGAAFVAVAGGSSPLTTKGDLYTFSTVDARLPVGANGTTLVADSVEATGLKWATPNGMTSIASGSIANSATGFSITGIAATFNNLQLVIRNSNSGANDINSRIRVNNLSTSIYSQMQNFGISTTTAAATAGTGTNFLLDNNNSSRTSNTSIYVINFWDYAGNAFKCGTVTGYHEDRTTGTFEIMTESFGVRTTTAIDRIDLISGNANAFAAAGTFTLYGVK